MLRVFGKAKPRVAVVRAAGNIMGGRGANRVNLQRLEKPLRKAYKMRNVKAVALVLNSPGGAPAQSSLIMKRIMQLKKETGVPTYAFVEDVAASGGYYLACAADKIYGDENSIVGSIGVLSAGFGLDKWIKRYDIDRRVKTAGKFKAAYDPFQGNNKQADAHLDDVLKKLHDNFQTAVKTSRGDRLKEDYPNLFEGQFWVANDAIEAGLIDGIGSLHETMAEILGEEPKFIETTKDRGFAALFNAKAAVEALQNPAAAASDMVSGALASVESDAAWKRFGITHHE